MVLSYTSDAISNNQSDNRVTLCFGSHSFQARDNKYAAIKDFLSKFPSIATNDVFLFGQSYGGIYIPMLSVKVMEDPDINFKVWCFLPLLKLNIS